MNLLDWLLRLSALTAAVLAVPRFLWRQRRQLRDAIRYICDWVRCRVRGNCPMKAVRGMTSPMIVGPDGSRGGETLFKCQICGCSKVRPLRREQD